MSVVVVVVVVVVVIVIVVVVVLQWTSSSHTKRYLSNIVSVTGLVSIMSSIVISIIITSV